MGFTWLHVSDFHLSSSNPYDSDVVLNALVESVQWYREQGNWNPDLIFATGDIAGKGDVGVFKGGVNAPATTFFDALLKAADLTREYLFIVPGNHDVERKKGIGLLRTLENQKDIDEYFQQSPMYHLTGKLAAYASWYNDYFNTLSLPRVFPDKSTCELISCEIKNIRLGLLLMNSTLFCKEAKSDHGMLCIGRSCINECITQLKKKRQKNELDLAFALVHHPFDWLHAKCERVKIKQSLKTHINILLQGHYHQTEVEPGGDIIQLAAGAAYLEDGPKRALYGCFEGTKIDVFPISYQEESAPGVWRVDPSVFPDENSHIKSFFIPGFPPPPPIPPVSPEGYNPTDIEYAAHYQNFLIAELENINQKLPNAIKGFSVKLSNIFIELRLSDTWYSELRFEPVSGLDQPIHGHIRTPADIMKLVFQKTHLMLVVGDPGSGKTTLLKHYALSCLENNGYKALGFTEPIMVFFLSLRELKKKDGVYLSLPAFIQEIYKEKYLVIPQAIFSGWLENRTTLVLLDGLDEISDVKDRKEVCAWINSIVTLYTNAFFVVTSRTTGYRQLDGISLNNSIRADIMDFTEDQQAVFLQKWFTSVLSSELPVGDETLWAVSQLQKAKVKADAISAYLKQDKEKSGHDKNKSLWALAGVPLLLQFMAMLWKENDCLPKSRTDLYKNVLDYLLGYQKKRQQNGLQLPVDDAIRVLAPVSLWWQQEVRKDHATKITMESHMQVELDKLDNPPTVNSFCEDLIYHAGLLIEYGKKDNVMYGFRHKSFREYMAAVQLSKTCRPKQITKLVNHFVDDWWSEPLRFFIGQCDECTVNAFIKAIFDSPISNNLSQKQQDLLVTLIEEAKAIDIEALQTRLNNPDTKKNQQRYLQECLRATGKQGALNAVREFVNKGQVNSEIDKLGAHYILIKGGTYTYSLTKQPEIVPDLYVAKFTVTNQLYGRFINYLASKEPEFAGILPLETYKTDLFKLAKGIKGFSDYLHEMDDLASRFLSVSADDKRFNKDEQPVIDVSWYAARAFCLWLSLIESGGANDHLYRLPTEIEWGYAAGGEESRTYPWGEQEPSSTRANYANNEGATTPVGRYPEGVTPEGLYDMAGNVWELMDDWYDTEKSARSLRGGSWGGKSDNLRCSARSNLNPDYRNYYIGFRVVRPGHFS